MTMTAEPDAQSQARQESLPAAEPSRPDTRLAAAIIGTGKISEEHLRYLKRDPHVSVVGVCDLSPSLAKYAVERFGAQKAFTDSRQMLEEARPDVVHVLTPPQTHVKLVSDALNAGAHVIVEKPVAPTNAEFQQLWDLARSRDRWLIEDHNYRFNQPIRAIERLLREGKLGEVREVEVRMTLAIRKVGGRYVDEALPHPSHQMPAGVLHEFITHLCYLALRFLPRVDDVWAEWSNVGGGTLFKYDDLDALVIGGGVHGRIRFTCHGAPDAFTVMVRGSRGWAETDLFQPYLRVVMPRQGGAQLSPLINHLANGLSLATAGVKGFRNKILQHTPYEGLGTFLTRTYAALRAGRQPPVTYDDMDGASRLVDELVKCQGEAAG
jgi:predicted dehydrogenase